MPGPSRQRHSFSLRAKIMVVSLLSFLVTTACSWLRLRATPTPEVTCYIMVEPTDTPTPVVMCYEMQMPTETPTPTPFISPLSPLPTPTPSPEARSLLLERLLAENRFPRAVARQLEI